MFPGVKYVGIGSDHFIETITGNLRKFWVHIFNQSFPVADGDTYGTLFQRFSKQPEFFFGFSPAGHIVNNGVKTILPLKPNLTGKNFYMSGFAIGQLMLLFFIKVSLFVQTVFWRGRAVCRGFNFNLVDIHRFQLIHGPAVKLGSGKISLNNLAGSGRCHQFDSRIIFKQMSIV